MRKIILATKSPRRKKILKNAGIKFKTVASNINEDLLIKKFKKRGIKNLAKILSMAKALSIVHKDGDEIIAGFDTLVVCKNKIIPKPKNKKDALKKLLFLSNKTHKVCTGICLVDLKKKIVFSDCEITKVKMKKITRKEALNYINTKEPMDKAGAYAIQGKGKKFIKNISGDYLNVVGLSLYRFIEMLKKFKEFKSFVPRSSPTYTI